MPTRSGKKTQAISTVKHSIRTIFNDAKKGNAVAYECIAYLQKALSGNLLFPQFIQHDKVLFQCYALLVESIQQEKYLDQIQSYFSPQETSGLNIGLFPFPAKDLATRTKAGSLDAFSLLIDGAKKNMSGARCSLEAVVYSFSNKLPLPTHSPHTLQCIQLFISHKTFSYLSCYTYAQSAIKASSSPS